MLDADAVDAIIVGDDEEDGEEVGKDAAAKKVVGAVSPLLPTIKAVTPRW